MKKFLKLEIITITNVVQNLLDNSLINMKQHNNIIKLNRTIINHKVEEINMEIKCGEAGDINVMYG